MYGLHKIQKDVIPLNSIDSKSDSARYPLSRFLVDIIYPQMDKLKQ